MSLRSKILKALLGAAAGAMLATAPGALGPPATPSSVLPPGGGLALIDTSDSVFLLLDHQSGLFQTVKDVSVTELRNNTVMLAKLATLLKIPVITTASEPNGPNGPLMPEIHQFAPHAVYVGRKGEVNAWDNEDFVKAVRATGKKTLRSMRKIIGSLFQSLDGVIQAPGGPEEDQTGFAHGGWVFPYFDDARAEPMGRLLGGSYELLLGRRTYEIFAAYWPHNGDQPIGATFNAVRKHVATSSDRPLTWNNSPRLLGEPAAAVARLKASDGSDLLIQGSSMLYQALLPAGLVDQLAFDHLPGHAWPRQALVFGLPATARSWTLVEQAHSPKGVHFASFARGEEVRTGSFATKPRAKTSLRSVSVKRRVVGEPAALRPALQQLHVKVLFALGRTRPRSR